MSDDNLLNINPASLTNRERGNLAELGFMRKAASFGFAVAKPWGECERYDVIGPVLGGQQRTKSGSQGKAERSNGDAHGDVQRN